MPNREKIASLLRFASTHDGKEDQRTSLEQYIERMPEDQDIIWYVTAETHQAASNSPHLEIFRKNGIEVLLMSDRIDEWMMGYFTDFQGKSFRSVAKGEVDFGEDEDSDKKEDEAEGPDSEMLKKIAGVLGDEVSEVRASKRLTESASCLVFGEQDLALHMRQMLEQAGQELPESRPALEINVEHPFFKRLSLAGDDDGFTDLAHLLHEQAVLSEGGHLKDPASFVQRMNRLMLEMDHSA